MNSHIEKYLAWLEAKVGADNRHVKSAHRYYARLLKTGDAQLGWKAWKAWKAIHQAVAEIGRRRSTRKAKAS
jgi:hypothetical protein